METKSDIDALKQKKYENNSCLNFDVINKSLENIPIGNQNVPDSVYESINNAIAQVYTNKGKENE